MKRTLLFVLAAATALSIVGCQKDPQPEAQNEGLKIERLRDVGKPIPNAKITLDDCIPEGRRPLCNPSAMSKANLSTIWITRQMWIGKVC